VVHHATIATDNYGWFGTKGLFRAIPGTSQIETAACAYIMASEESYGGWDYRAASNTSNHTGIVWGKTVSSMVTGYNSNVTVAAGSLDDLGYAWIKTFLG
jgi:hypothetical protein